MPLKVLEATRIFEDVGEAYRGRRGENTPMALADTSSNPRPNTHKKTTSTTSFKNFFSSKDKVYDKENVGEESQPSSPKKVKAGTNIAGLLKKRSKKDLQDQPGTTSPEKIHTPLWAQFATQPLQGRDGEQQYPVNYQKPSLEPLTPQLFSQDPDKGSHSYFDIAPELRMPQQPYLQKKGSRSSIFTEDLEGKHSMELERPPSRGSPTRPECSRQQSALSQCDTADATDPVLQDRSNKPRSKMFDIIGTLGKRTREKIAIVDKAELEAQDLDSVFESVLEKNDIPHNLRDHMRNLKPEVKASLVHGARVGSGSSTEDPLSKKKSTDGDRPVSKDDGENRARSRSRSRPRSGVFSISKRNRDPSANAEPSTRSWSKNRSRSKSQDVSTRPLSMASNASAVSLASLAPKDSATTPGDFIHYLTEVRKPELVEVGKLHKLRISLRVESVQWTDAFVRHGGMAELVSLLHRIMAMEWREEHEDSLLHETLLCLKALSTTNLAMQRLADTEKDLLPALLKMLFDTERRGPAEFGTRSLIIQIVFAHLRATLHMSEEEHHQRAREVLLLMRDAPSAADRQPHSFLAEMHTSRPYRTWCKEVVNVTKEVFWIFLHHMTVVPIIMPAENTNFAQRFFPTSRAPHPAAPYVGGVEWEATQYLGAHLDLLNGLIVSLPYAERMNLREELKQSGFEKIMGSHLRTCKEKFYSAVHDGLRLWVAAAKEDGWSSIESVRAGPPRPAKSPTAPQLDVKVGSDWL